MTKTELDFQKQYGHYSLCNCIRRFRGRLIVTRRKCDCGYTGMTHEKAYTQAIAELGHMTSENHRAILQRIKQIKQAATV